MARLRPSYDRESALAAAGCRAVAGVDEVGRGPLAGPVAAAAVILHPDRIPEGLDDSKRLSPARRAALAERLTETAETALGWASVDEIAALNVLGAALLAMRRALAALPRAADHALIDGNRLPPALPCPATCVVKGDAQVLSIAAASILAKVARDRLMVDLAQQYPGYEWDKNVGYPTAAHLDGLKRHGVTPHHRRNFRPVHNMLYQEKT
ncbi:ribonuclease HII [Rhodobacteraceae bacterium CCMM004]|nr:ribonuclease HII [Rhodobacteraceae bacterium CCMM004]